MEEALYSGTLLNANFKESLAIVPRVQEILITPSNPAWQTQLEHWAQPWFGHGIIKNEWQAPERKTNSQSATIQRLYTHKRNLYKQNTLVPDSSRTFFFPVSTLGAV